MQSPFSTYNGGKAGHGTYQAVINQIPQCKLFIDAMVGNGGIVRNLRLPDLTVINDIKAGLTASYDCTAVPAVIKEQLDYRDLIAKYDWQRPSVVFYFDPPYLKSSRKSQKNLYDHEWNDQDHLQFLIDITQMKSNVLVSHYPCDLYDRALNSWRSVTYQSITRQGLATEKLWMNFPPPGRLQDYRYLGNSYTQRQAIKRQKNRIATKLATLPEQQLQAILEQLYFIKKSKQ